MTKLLFKERDCIFVDRSSEGAIESGISDDMANCRWNKLLGQMYGPYKLLAFDRKPEQQIMKGYQILSPLFPLRFEHHKGRWQATHNTKGKLWKHYMIINRNTLGYGCKEWDRRRYQYTARLFREWHYMSCGHAGVQKMRGKVVQIRLDGKYH